MKTVYMITSGDYIVHRICETLKMQKKFCANQNALSPTYDDIYEIEEIDLFFGPEDKDQSYDF